MKTFCFALSVFLLTYANVAAQLDETSSQLLRRAQTNGRRRASKIHALLSSLTKSILTITSRNSLWNVNFNPPTL
ncbi:hypothetical protein MHU86_10232 [Fragilaria crotonensis]|nr:hypothetical protein MHU86_10232 [Fragilaria crotonensis]